MQEDARSAGLVDMEAVYWNKSVFHSSIFAWFGRQKVYKLSF